MRDIGHIHDIRERLLSGKVIVNLGGIGPAEVKQLNKWARDGRLKKWRGRWFPVAGTQVGIGPLKTCWALPEVHDAVNFKVRAA